MSSAEGDLDRVEAVHGNRPKREPLQRRRLDLIYFALAGFDLLTIGFTLLLSNHIMGLYEESVSRSAVWSLRVGQLVELAQHAQEANAPGNDVFDSHDVARERARRDDGVERYRHQRDQVFESLSATEPGENISRVTGHLRTAEQHLEEMTREADRIFALIEAGDDEAAGRRMATMDRIYGRLSRSLLNAVMAVQQIEDANLQRQVALASDLRRLELMVMALIFAIVVGVAFYGRSIGKVMRRTEDAHNSMLQELEAANEGLQNYADNVAHELRNPVNKMLLASEVVLSRSRTTEEYQDTLVSIVEESQRLSSIVGSLLFLARARRTHVDLELQRMEVGAEVAVIADYFETAAQEAGIALTATRSEALEIEADRTLFQRAISNLISNAIAHTGTGGTISIDVSATDKAVMIEVRDSGEGVPEEEQGRVFDRFYRADRARSAASGRLGLGLPIARSIMELHGGEIWLRSKPGHGTSVVLSFPRATASAELQSV